MWSVSPRDVYAAGFSGCPRLCSLLADASGRSWPVRYTRPVSSFGSGNDFKSTTLLAIKSRDPQRRYSFCFPSGVTARTLSRDEITNIAIYAGNHRSHLPGQRLGTSRESVRATSRGGITWA